MLRALVIKLAVIHVMLKRHGPGDVVDLRDVIAVRLQSAKELVKPESGVSSYMGDTDRLAWRMECSGNDNSGDVINRDHVDRIVDVGTGR